MTEVRTRLVVNADDLGLHAAIDAGILAAHREGVVTSATVLVTGPTAEDAVRSAREQGLPLGVHLCLTGGFPAASSVPGAAAPGGRFRAHWPDVVLARARGELDGQAVLTEWRAQLSVARRLGFQPDHLDAHQHLQLLPGLAGVLRQLAAEHGLPVRWPLERPRAGWLRAPGPLLKSSLLSALAHLPGRAPPRALPAYGVFESGALDERSLLSLLSRLPPGACELVCHPGLSDELRVASQPLWRYGWGTELRALCSPAVKEALSTHGIQLTSYGALFGEGARA